MTISDKKAASLCPLGRPADECETKTHVVELKLGRTIQQHQGWLQSKGSDFKPCEVKSKFEPLPADVWEKLFEGGRLTKEARDVYATETGSYITEGLDKNTLELISSDTENVAGVTCNVKVDITLDSN
jgi:hypothetical protein